ncbi:sulfhydryl oxidase 2 [Drosophila yakuba]|uniref:Sulfhydryl oxidase n=1 Tax=Drosophila yakuba TaxID=7245 RepID=B4PNW2_DROYA|nr:sulfhydryl oxidase 2 [Drosophila yakuba]EDW98172.1 uncharacterized protein Dyak_GE10385 [Drosophila yakuba]
MTPNSTPLLLCILIFSTGHSELLFNPDDNVQLLDFASFEYALSEPTSGKLVQFFNAFCEDSQQFVPAFRNVSRKLYKWRRVLKVHVLDCGKDENDKICGNYSIRKTPTLRYFPPSYKRVPEDLGIEITNRNPKEIESKLALNLQKLNYFKMFKPQDNVTHIFQNDEHVEYVVFVYQMCLNHFLPHLETGNSMEEKYASQGDCDEDNPIVSVIGRNTLLDLLPYKEVVVRIFDNHDIYNKFGISPVPNLLVVVNKARKLLFLTPEMDNSKAYVAAIKQFLIFVDRKPQQPLPKTAAANISEVLRYQIFEQLEQHPTRIYRADLERAINHILNVELSRASHFVGTKLVVLRNFVKLIYNSSPLKAEAQDKLAGLYYSLRAKKQLSGVGFKDLLLKSVKDYVFDGKQFIGCIATRPLLRGFNCSLWMLFHYLSVESKELKARSLLLVFLGYVRFFMNCRECDMKLGEFKKLRPIGNVSNNDEQILWLWEAHNYVNKLLAGDATEDPKFPKIQFPSELHCPNCRNNQSEWRTDEVLKYLKAMYALKNLSWFGMSASKSYSDIKRHVTTTYATSTL